MIAVTQDQIKTEIVAVPQKWVVMEFVIAVKYMAVMEFAIVDLSMIVTQFAEVVQLHHATHLVNYHMIALENAAVQRYLIA